MPWWIAEELPGPEAARHLLKALTAALIAVIQVPVRRDVQLSKLVNAALAAMDGHSHADDLAVGIDAAMNALDAGGWIA